MENKICAVTEVSDQYFHFTRVAISSFIEHNPWFDGTIYLLSHNLLPVSQKNLTSLSSIYRDIEVIDITEALNKYSDLFEHSRNAETVHSVIRYSVFDLNKKKLLYFSSHSLFLKNVSSLLIPEKISATPNSLSMFYLDTQIDLYRDYYLEIEDGKKLFSSSQSNFETVLFSKMVESRIYVASNLTLGFSSQFKDSSFNKLRQNINSISCLVFNTFSQKVKEYSKINLIWLQKNKLTVTRANRPMNFNHSNRKIKGWKIEDLETAVSHSSLNFDFKLSIIIPAFNVSEYIEECLDSIYLQNHSQSFEILVGVDNCKSTLETLIQIEKKYPNLSVYYSESNVGPYTMRNNLSRIAKYPNLLFFDADDIMKSNLISTLHSFYSPNRPIRFKYVNFDSGTNHLASTSNHPTVAHGVFFSPKEVFEKVGGFQDWPCGADTEFMKRCENNNIKDLNLNRYLFYRRIHSQSLTQNVRTNASSNIRKVIRDQIKNTRNWTIPISPKHINFKKIIKK